jgi:tripartite-type tricarboxylate transporter receptor subunit TctC
VRYSLPAAQDAASTPVTGTVSAPATTRSAVGRQRPHRGGFETRRPPERLELLPDVPTYTELGYPEVDIYGWRGVIGPKGLPQEVVDKWADAIKKTQESKAWQGLITKLGDVPTYMGPQEFKEHIDKSFKTYRKMAEDLGILVN